jgi:DNA end-binding protein Ku
MRAMWKGAVSFGLVNVPVKMYTATTSHDLSFHQVHKSDGGRIRYRRVCEVCGEEVGYDDIAKGYESPEGQLVILTDADLAELPVSGSREIEVERFVPADQVDPILFEKSYYLEPEKTGAKPYALLREALRAADRMALVRVAIRQRSTLAVLRVRDDVIVLQTMLWPDEVREAAFPGVTDGADLKPQELAMASSLVESMTGDYDPAEYGDDYRDVMESLVTAKLAGGDVRDVPGAGAPDPAAGGGQVVDLMAALQRSVDAVRERQGAPKAAGETDSAAPATKAAAKQAAAAETTTARAAPARTTTAKKATAKKATAKKATAKQATAKQATAKQATAKTSAKKDTTARKAVRRSA